MYHVSRACSCRVIIGSIRQGGAGEYWHSEQEGVPMPHTSHLDDTSQWISNISSCLMAVELHWFVKHVLCQWIRHLVALVGSCITTPHTDRHTDTPHTHTHTHTHTQTHSADKAVTTCVASLIKGPVSC